MDSVVGLVLFGGLIITGLWMHIDTLKRPKFRRIYGDPSLPYGDTWVRTDETGTGYSGGFVSGDCGAGFGGGCDGGGHGGGGGSC